ncbi:hypothetical protein SDC9_08622 [bioreactor metagenome]|uniref:Resolvase HTH domain-containing protein n=1 Tax=bioreactor metagenome TaxID=1076179 RepID=A0A644TA15_9ZZZZ|nr:resolvase [Methanobrevibacter sp.]MEA4957660.1 resolvase [Methanobrevibacter sp.]
MVIEEENNENGSNVHISSQLSSKMIVDLMDKYPNLKKITCPPSIYNRISKKYLEVLEELEIDVEVKHNWRTPKKYSDEKKKEIIDLIKNGSTPFEIAEHLNLPLKTVYYMKNSYDKEKIKLKRGKKNKYDDSIRTRIKNLYKSGVSAQKIAKKEKIPIRTIYYIIKNG